MPLAELLPSSFCRDRFVFSRLHAGTSVLGLLTWLLPTLLLLPLLQQLHPTVPVLFEHTAAGLRTAHDRQPFAWVVLGPFVVLVNSSMQSYCSDDLRALLSLLTEPANAPAT